MVFAACVAGISIKVNKEATCPGSMRVVKLAVYSADPVLEPGKSQMCVKQQSVEQSRGTLTFQDVKEKVFPAEPILKLRSSIPGKLRRLVCWEPSNTRCSYTCTVRMIYSFDTRGVTPCSCAHDSMSIWSVVDISALACASHRQFAQVRMQL